MGCEKTHICFYREMRMIQPQSFALFNRLVSDTGWGRIVAAIGISLLSCVGDRIHP